MTRLSTISQIRHYIADMLKDEVAVGGKVFLNRPSALFLEELPAVFVYLTDDSGDIISGSRNLVREYEINQQVSITIVVEDVLDPDGDHLENRLGEDYLDYLSLQVKGAFNNDWTLARRLPDFDANSNYDGIAHGLRYVNGSTYEPDVEGDRRMIAKTLNYLVLYNEPGYTDFKLPDFTTYYVELLPPGTIQDIEQTELCPAPSNAFLTRYSDDWADFDSKSPLVGTDRFLLEDSESAYRKKKTTLADMLSVEGIIHHGGLVGLLDDDHTQYLLINGTRAMSGDLDMANNNVNNVECIQFNLAPLEAHSEGRICWNDDDKTVDINTEILDVSIQSGQEVVLRCTNKTGSVIPNGSIVYVDGAQGQRPTIELAVASNIYAYRTIGMTTHDIADNSTGYVTTYGLVRFLDTSSFIDGDPLFLSDVTPGGSRTTLPDAPNINVVVGIVVYAHATEGKVFIKPIAFPGLTLLSDVSARSGITNNSLLWWQTATSTWDELLFTDLNTTLDHGLLDGLGDDDHTQYLLIDGTRAMTGNLNMDGNSIINVPLLTSTSAEMLFQDSVVTSSVSLQQLAAQARVAGELTGTKTADLSLATLSVNDTTRTFSITPTGANFKYYYRGTEVTKTSAQSVVFPDLDGIHFMYFNESGVLTTTQLESTWLDVITLNTGVPVAYIQWDADNNVTIFIAEERHGLMPGPTHAHLHQAFGTQWYGGGALTDITADGTGNSDSHAQLGVASVSISDEDLYYDISNGSPQTINFPAQIPVYYRSGSSGVWRKKTADTFPIIYSGTAGYAGTRLPYNEYTGSTWQLTEVGNNDFVLVHYFATNEISEPIIGIQGQDTYANIISAREGAAAEIDNLVTTGLEIEEFTTLGTVIYQTSNTDSNTVKGRIRSTDTGEDYVDWRGNLRATGGGGGVTDHGLLSGLSDDDHVQYMLIDGTRAMTGGLDMGTNTISNITNISNGALAFGNASSVLTGDSTYLTWDTTNRWLKIGSGTPNRLVGNDCLYVESRVEFDFIVYFDSQALIYGSLKTRDDVQFRLGTNDDSRLLYSTDQTNDALIWGIPTSNAVIFCENADISTNFTHAAQTDPTVYIQSADATSVNDYIAFQHDQTDALILSGAGSIGLVDSYIGSSTYSGTFKIGASASEYSTMVTAYGSVSLVNILNQIDSRLTALEP